MIVNGIHLQTPIKLFEQATAYGTIIQRGYPIVQEMQVMGQFFILEFFPRGLVKKDDLWVTMPEDKHEWILHGNRWSLYVKASRAGPIRDFDLASTPHHWNTYKWTENHYRWGKEGVFEYMHHEFEGDVEDFQNSMFYIKMIEDQEDWKEYLY